ncbi:hypothetical protein BGX21_000870 [Mortierella sp. AD011]|nr:hypothetical protein BGX20_000977 [Mortierella sp. AD010]KAF9386165.1 hypothetical protein BGX21_000870 [Mortierella sp. AD011]
MSGKSSTQKTSSAVSSGVKVSTHSSTTTTTRRTIAVNNTAKIQEIGDDEDEEDEEDSDYDDSDSNSSESDIDEIPDPEKWRIIKESGIIEQVGANEKYRQDTPIDDSDRDYIFEGIFFSIPTTCLFIVMDILVHRQYAETYTGIQVVQKALKIFPAILIMVYFSNKFKTSKLAQGAMFVVSIICGCYFLHTMYRSPAMGIMLRAPGIITILVYCIVQLQLIPAVISLAICGLYYEFGNVKYH